MWIRTQRDVKFAVLSNQLSVNQTYSVCHCRKWYLQNWSCSKCGTFALNLPQDGLIINIVANYYFFYLFMLVLKIKYILNIYYIILLNLLHMSCVFLWLILIEACDICTKLHNAQICYSNESAILQHDRIRTKIFFSVLWLNI